MNRPTRRTGIDALLAQGGAALRGCRVGLLSHPASIDACGRPVSEVLRRLPGFRLTALFGPEHGFRGMAAAGVPVADACCADGGIPVYSLYGEQRSPTEEALSRVDVMLCDLQDIGVRCYTYVSTLRAVLSAAAHAGKAVVVADRPIPLPNAVDGPMPDPACAGFVNAVPAPLSYGMTPGEAARWLCRRLNLDVALTVLPVPGYRRDRFWGRGGRRWLPPSPALRSWNAAACYAGTVLAEALPSLDLQRGCRHAFEGVAAPWLRAEAVCERLVAQRWPGAVFSAARTRVQGKRSGAVRIRVADPTVYRPVRTGLALLAAIAAEHGADRLWADARIPFFDQLAGTPEARNALRGGMEPDRIADLGAADRAVFMAERRSALLYHGDTAEPDHAEA